jgi:2-polyprenyl-6-hydroxyphenyl methylase/3-demethylubiquinone-9 3-methyltransferase
MTGHAAEVASGQRFAFGENWSQFLRGFNESRLTAAVGALGLMLGRKSLEGQTFLDIGSGSGLSSLAARRMGARVVSFDYDPQSVACTTELRRRFYPDDPNWQVYQGSALDPDYVGSLGQFDIVYSWGVLHHTGQMWTGLANAILATKPGGLLFVAIYNDQGKMSRYWLRVKKLYNAFPPPLRFLVLWPAFIQLWGKRLLKDLLLLRPMRTWNEIYAHRGMSAWWDVIDWVGGLPFEVAKPEEIFDFYHQRGFDLVRMTTQAGDLGCNEFVFQRRA